MIDRLREQLQERLDQLLSEADRLRKALAALDTRSPQAPPRERAVRKTAEATGSKPASTAATRTPARRTAKPAARPPRRTAPGATKAAVLAALAGGEAMTAGEVATKAGLARATCRRRSRSSPSPARSRKQSAATGCQRQPGRRLPPRARSDDHELVDTGRRRCLRMVLPLGFRFDVDAVVLGGVAHRTDCDGIDDRFADDAAHVFAGDVHRAQRCPRECQRCRPSFETLLTHQLERPNAAAVP